jgi:dihydrofolate synthase/folylpolyglutamate synthase
MKEGLDQGNHGGQIASFASSLAMTDDSAGLRLHSKSLRITDRLQSITLKTPLLGDYQIENFKTVITAWKVLSNDWKLDVTHLQRGFENVKLNTKFYGRWEILSTHPLIVADVAHNEEGIRSVIQKARDLGKDNIRIIFGCVKDKDVKKVLTLLPKEAIYYFTQPAIPRAMAVDVLYEDAKLTGLKGEKYLTVADAYQKALGDCLNNDLILITGSFFVVCDVPNIHINISESN